MNIVKEPAHSKSVNDLHAGAINLAESLVEHHIEYGPEECGSCLGTGRIGEPDGTTRNCLDCRGEGTVTTRKCFNLFTYIESLEQEIETHFADSSNVGRFELDAHRVARYLWCCLAIASDDRPDGDTFRGMDILD